jgi:hypothetical protein
MKKEREWSKERFKIYGRRRGWRTQGGNLQ